MSQAPNSSLSKSIDQSPISKSNSSETANNEAKKSKDATQFFKDLLKLRKAQIMQPSQPKVQEMKKSVIRDQTKSQSVNVSERQLSVNNTQKANNSKQDVKDPVIDNKEQGPQEKPIPNQAAQNTDIIKSQIPKPSNQSPMKQSNSDDAAKIQAKKQNEEKQTNFFKSLLTGGIHKKKQTSESKVEEKKKDIIREETKSQSVKSIGKQLQVDNKQKANMSKEDMKEDVRDINQAKPQKQTISIQTVPNISTATLNPNNIIPPPNPVQPPVNSDLPSTLTQQKQALITRHKQQLRQIQQLHYYEIQQVKKNNSLELQALKKRLEGNLCEIREGIDNLPQKTQSKRLDEEIRIREEHVKKLDQLIEQRRKDYDEVVNKLVEKKKDDKLLMMEQTRKEVQDLRKKSIEQLAQTKRNIQLQTQQIIRQQRAIFQKKCQLISQRSQVNKLTNQAQTKLKQKQTQLTNLQQQLITLHHKKSQFLTNINTSLQQKLHLTMYLDRWFINMFRALEFRESFQCLEKDIQVISKEEGLGDKMKQEVREINRERERVRGELDRWEGLRAGLGVFKIVELDQVKQQWKDRMVKAGFESKIMVEGQGKIQQGSLAQPVQNLIQLINLKNCLLMSKCCLSSLLKLSNSLLTLKSTYICSFAQLQANASKCQHLTKQNQRLTSMFQQSIKRYNQQILQLKKQKEQLALKLAQKPIPQQKDDCDMQSRLSLLERKCKQLQKQLQSKEEEGRFKEKMYLREIKSLETIISEGKNTERF